MPGNPRGWNARAKAPVLSALLLSLWLVSPDVTAAASPSSGKIGFGGSLSWSGGPLAGTAGGGPETGGPGPGCTPVTCDDFLLNVQVRPSPLAGLRRIVEIELTTTAQIVLFVYPPHSSPIDDWEGYTLNKARLVNPRPGIWRIRAFCVACAGSTYEASATTRVVPTVTSPLPPRGRLRFRVVRMPTSGGGEPNVWAARNGVFINSPFTNGGPTIFRSLDGGAHFLRKSHFDTVPIRTSMDADAAVAPDDGTVYAVNRNGGAAGFAAGTQQDARHYVYRSFNRGRTFEGPVEAAGPNVDRPWLAAGRDGLVYLVQTGANPGEPRMPLLRSTDHGQTFTLVSDVLATGGAPPGCTGNMGRPVLNPTDQRRLYLVYRARAQGDCEGDTREIWFARSTDGGLTWHHHLIARPPHSIGPRFADLARDRAGTLYAVWVEESATGNTHVRLAVSTDDGHSFKGPFRIDCLGDHRSNVFASVAAGQRGRVDVAWYTSTAKSYRDQHGRWTVALARSTNGRSRSLLFSQSRVSPAVVRVGCIDGILLPPCDRFADFLGLDIGPDGLANVVWSDSTADDGGGQQILNYYAKERHPRTKPPHQRPDTWMSP